MRTIRRTVVILYALALLSLVVGTAAISMALIEPIPLRWLYWHYFVRKPLAWCILLGSAGWVAWATWRSGSFLLWTIGPMLLMALGTVLAHRLHQERVFTAIDDPPVADDPRSLPLDDEAEMAVVEHGGVTRAYALDHLIHHHIFNDRFGDRTVSVTYCAMCRTILPFDVSDIGPLFVASLKNANMVIADRRTRTFFQQATFESVIGELHPHTLTMIPFQLLPWREVKRLRPMPKVATLSRHDLRDFTLPIPGLWRRIMAGEATPGLSARRRDTTLPARARVIGLLESTPNPPWVYVKSELPTRGVVQADDEVTLVAIDGVVNGFRAKVRLTEDQQLTDEHGTMTWDLRGKLLHGDGGKDLTPVKLSDEYWFSWKLFRGNSRLVRLTGDARSELSLGA